MKGVDINFIVVGLNKTGQENGRLVVQTYTELNDEGKNAYKDLQKKGWKIKIKHGSTTI